MIREPINLRPQDSEAPAFMRVTAPQLTTIVQRCSPHHREGRWASAECALLAACVSHWLLDLVLVAREQFREERVLWASGKARALLLHERASVDAMASWLGLGSDCLDRLLAALHLNFPREAGEAPRRGHHEGGHTCSTN